MTLAGSTNKIPADDIIDAMYRIGKILPPSLRETGLVGLTAISEGVRLKMKIFGIEINISEEESSP